MFRNYEDNNNSLLIFERQKYRSSHQPENDASVDVTGGMALH
jgi:hypothetical protein